MLRLNKNAAKQNANIYSTCGMYTFLKKLVMRFPEKLAINFFDIFFLYFITDLSQYENYKLKGRDTHIWKGSWNKNLKETIQVAVKQLKPNEKNMLPFSQMCSNATSWDDPTLVKVYG